MRYAKHEAAYAQQQAGMSVPRVQGFRSQFRPYHCSNRLLGFSALCETKSYMFVGSASQLIGRVTGSFSEQQTWVLQYLGGEKLDNAAVDGKYDAVRGRYWQQLLTCGWLQLVGSCNFSQAGLPSSKGTAGMKTAPDVLLQYPLNCGEAQFDASFCACDVRAIITAAGLTTCPTRSLHVCE